VIRIFLLPSFLRKKLKEPLGTLIRGDFDETIVKLKNLVKKESPPKLISVGDAVTKSIIENGMVPDVFILDDKIMREPIVPLNLASDHTLMVENPPGTLSEEAWRVLETAMSNPGKTKIKVKGEEDLLTLVAILCAPIGSLVLYGQPREGVVAVKVTQDKKNEIKRLLGKFHYVPSKN